MGSISFDQATPGTGPPGLVSANAPSVEFGKYDRTFNLSLKSRSDLNLNPNPEGFIKSAFPKSQKTREGIYAIETDRGELSPTINTQINVKGQRQFVTRLQDTVKPTTKETTLYSYEGNVNSVTKAHALYSQFIPVYAKIGNKNVRINGASNFGLKSATEYSYFAGAAPTGINGQAIQNPNVIGKNTKPVSDYHIDGPGTIRNALPDGTKFQNYKLISKPKTNGLKISYNLETEGSDRGSYSQLLGKKVDGIENRYTASYQIAPLFTNPLNMVWNPENKGELPAFYTNSNAPDYSSIQMKQLPDNEYLKGGYNSTWSNDRTKNSINSYVLGMEEGVYNPMIEYSQGLNDKFGTFYGEKAMPGASYNGNRSIDDLFNNDEESINKAYPHVNNTYRSLGVN